MYGHEHSPGSLRHSEPKRLRRLRRPAPVAQQPASMLCKPRLSSSALSSVRSLHLSPVPRAQPEARPREHRRSVRLLSGDAEARARHGKRSRQPALYSDKTDTREAVGASSCVYLALQSDCRPSRKILDKYSPQTQNSLAQHAIQVT